MAELPYGGAYGLALPQLTAGVDLLPAPSHWTPWSITWSDEAAFGPWEWSPTRAVLPIRPRGRVVITLDDATTVIHEAPRSDQALLHPYLGSTALAAAAWQGRLALHAGVVVRDGRAWGLLGDRGAGKSSTLMWWSINAGRIAADDLLITDGRLVVAGPRFIDLRAGAARQYGTGADVGVLGTRRRWRVPIDAVAPEMPLAGLIELGWGPKIEICPVPIEERLGLLIRHRGLHFPVDDQVSTLRSMALPTVRFVRPKTWESSEKSLGELVKYVDTTS